MAYGVVVARAACQERAARAAVPGAAGPKAAAAAVGCVAGAWRALAGAVELWEAVGEVGWDSAAARVAPGQVGVWAGARGAGRLFKIPNKL